MQHGLHPLETCCHGPCRHLPHLPFHSKMSSTTCKFPELSGSCTTSRQRRGTFFAGCVWTCFPRCVGETYTMQYRLQRGTSYQTASSREGPTFQRNSATAPYPCFSRTRPMRPGPSAFGTQTNSGTSSGVLEPFRSSCHFPALQQFLEGLSSSRKMESPRSNS